MNAKNLICFIKIKEKTGKIIAMEIRPSTLCFLDKIRVVELFRECKNPKTINITGYLLLVKTGVMLIF